MTTLAQRAAVNDPAAWAELTDHQRSMVLLMRRPMPDGSKRSVPKTARAMGIHPNSLRETLRLAYKKLRFAGVHSPLHRGMEQPGSSSGS